MFALFKLTMKKIILTLVLIFSFNIAKAQTETIIMEKGKVIKSVKGAYYKTPNKLINKFLGKWEYKNGNETFKFKITKEKRYLKGGDTYLDFLNAKYCYNKGVDCSFSKVIDKLVGTIIPLEESANFTFYDKKHKKYGELIFSILEDGTAKWVLQNREVTYTSTNRPNPGFSVPEKMILTKVK